MPDLDLLTKLLLLIVFLGALELLLLLIRLRVFLHLLEMGP